jgi:hypothetical protein
METNLNASVSKLGFWSAVLATVFSLTYDAGQLAEWLGMMGSGGGPENPSTPLGLIVLLTPSLLLAPAFALLVLCVHYYAPPDKKIWSHAAVMFATVYTVMVCINYYVQLTLVVPHLKSGEIDSIRPFLFTPFDSFIYSVDVLGYSFMSLSTLFAAFVFTGTGLAKTVRFFLIANGLLIPFLALQIFCHPLIWPAALWSVTFPGATISLALLFKRTAGIKPPSAQAA